MERIGNIGVGLVGHGAAKHIREKGYPLTPATAFAAQACNRIYQLADCRGHGERFMPMLPGILAELIGAPIGDPGSGGKA